MGYDTGVLDMTEEIEYKYQDEMDKKKRKPEIWCESIDKQEQFYLDFPEEEGFPWTEAGIRCMILIKELEKRIAVLEKDLNG